jgi:starch-binding outer membrane protein, SusD/RagB family
MLPFAESTDLANAAARCSEVITTGGYDLFPNYADVFDLTKENGIEHIFSIQFDNTPGTNGSAFVGFLTPPQVYAGSFGSFQVERPFYNSFKPADSIRRKTSIYDKGVGAAAYDFVTNPSGVPFCAKYKDPNYASCRNNYPILRFADVLLMESEALNAINPTNPNRYNGINKVRNRAKLPNLTPNLTGPAFADSVLQERSWELCFEGQRRYDLIRMGKLVQVMTALGKTNIRPFHNYYPVPQPEIDLNANLLPQNPGY